MSFSQRLILSTNLLLFFSSLNLNLLEFILSNLLCISLAFRLRLFNSMRKIYILTNFISILEKSEKLKNKRKNFSTETWKTHILIAEAKVLCRKGKPVLTVIHKMNRLKGLHIRGKDLCIGD